MGRTGCFFSESGLIFCERKNNLFEFMWDPISYHKEADWENKKKLYWPFKLCIADSGHTKIENGLVLALNYKFKFQQKLISLGQSWWLMKRKLGLLEPRNAPSHRVATNARLEDVMLPISIWREGQLVVFINLRQYHFLWIFSVCLEVPTKSAVFL